MRRTDKTLLDRIADSHGHSLRHKVQVETRNDSKGSQRTVEGWFSANQMHHFSQMVPLLHRSAGESREIKLPRTITAGRDQVAP
jgi:hypothetical protein